MTKKDESTGTLDKFTEGSLIFIKSTQLKYM